MPPTNESTENPQTDGTKQSGEIRQTFKFIYRDTEYDFTGYAKKHPGGLEFFEKQQQERDDITEYFQALHSKDAEKIIANMPKTGKVVKQSADSLIYEELREKTKYLIKNNYLIDGLYGLCVLASFLLGCFHSNPIIGFFGLFCSQIVSGWLCHSWAHGRDKILNGLVTPYSALVAGVSVPWWNRKHNLHHMFTNVYGKDEDIQHSYIKALFGFLYMKWFFDSVVFDLKKPNVLVLILHLVLMLQQNILVVLLALYLSGTYSAHVLVGNHENEQAFEGKHGLDFITHQIVTARDYDYHGVFWTTFMGGMQYQSEHHLFPQVPFYNLPELQKVLKIELGKRNIEIKVDTIFS